MAHFAKVVGGIVQQVIVAEQEFIGQLEDTELWVQTSYTTHGGVNSEGGPPLRKNYAGVGYSYDVTRDAFIPPKPFNSWVLDEETCLWEAPIPMPQDGNRYDWDEKTTTWKKYAPEVVSMRQARLALLQANLLDPVNNAIASMPGVAGEAARIEWEYAQEVRRDSQLVVGLTGALQLSPAMLDELFILAGGL